MELPVFARDFHDRGGCSLLEPARTALPAALDPADDGEPGHPWSALPERCPGRRHPWRRGGPLGGSPPHGAIVTSVGALLRASRPRQWTKNILVLAAPA